MGVKAVTAHPDICAWSVQAVLERAVTEGDNSTK